MEIPRKRYFLEAHIVNHSIGSEKTFPYAKFIEYELILNTKYKIWYIKRRYTIFDELHKKLMKNFPNLPTLPKKAIFFNFSEKLIEERKIGLQNYLNQLFHIINFYTNTDLLEFIEIDREVLLLMTKANTFVDHNIKKLTFIKPVERNNNSFVESSDSQKLLQLNEQQHIQQTLENQIQDRPASISSEINDFLESLEQNGENKIKSVEHFVSFLKSKRQWPNIKKEDVARLLFGDLNSHKGLIFHCGTIEENKLGAEACINLFGKLISFEFNPDCEFYIQVLKKMPLSHLKKMNLMVHIRNNNKETCYQILNIIKDKDDKENVFRQLMSGPDAMENYESWMGNSNQMYL
jgi:hypothetical protein